jgi:hypothetical protein
MTNEREKKIRFAVADLSVLQEAYPELVTEETVVHKVVDKKRLYKVIKLNAELGRSTPGITMIESAEVANA